MYRVAYLSLFLILLSCGTSRSPKPGNGDTVGATKSEEVAGLGEELGTSVQMIDSYTVACTSPYRATVGKAFKVQVYLKDDAPTKVERVTMGGSESITYDPDHFVLHKGTPLFVTATVKDKGFGLAYVEAIGPKIGDFCDLTINIGFPGQLKAPISSLSYNQPRTFSVQIADSNDKPLPVEAPLFMEIQSWDALLGERSIPRPEENPGRTIRLPVPIGSTSSPPFVVTAISEKGGTVHLLATLKTNTGAVVAQSTLSVESKPEWWLPVAMAIAGALLYALYRVLQEDDLWKNWRTLLPRRLLVGLFAGGIAYLFADSDPLGLKLDPHVLRTYPVLGFLFSFLGIDVLLSKFGPKNTGRGDSGSTESDRHSSPDGSHAGEIGAVETKLKSALTRQ
jgi:hypothetical protein